MSLDDITVQKTIANKLKHNDYQLRNYVIQQLKTDNLMGEYIKIICTVQEHHALNPAEHAFFVKKKCKQIDDISQELSKDVFKKEVATFRMLQSVNLPTLNSLFPKCYYFDDQHLILEDLVAEGYKCMLTDRVATEDELLLSLQTLAGMHAASIAYEEQQSAKYPQQEPIRLITEFPEAFVEKYFNIEDKLIRNYTEALMKGLKTAIKVFGFPEVLQSGKYLKDELARLWDVYNQSGIKPSTTYRNVMCHCDLWAGNIFTKYDKDKKPLQAKIIDYQVVRYQPPASDVLNFILLNTTRDYRRKNMLKLKEIYYNFFCKYLEEYGINSLKIYTFNEYMDSFKDFVFINIFVALCTIPVVCNADIMQSEQFYSIIMEDSSPLYSPIFTRNKNFSQRVKDCLMDMIEYFENN